MSPPQKNPQNPQTTPLLCKSYLADEHPWILRGIHEEQSRWLRRFPEIQVIPLGYGKRGTRGTRWDGMEKMPMEWELGWWAAPTLYKPDLEGFPWRPRSWQAPVWDPDSAAAVFSSFSFPINTRFSSPTLPPTTPSPITQTSAFGFSSRGWWKSVLLHFQAASRRKERNPEMLKCQPLLFLQPFPGSSSGCAVCIPIGIRRSRLSLFGLALSVVVLQGKKPLWQLGNASVGQPGVSRMGIILSCAWNAPGALGSSLEPLRWDFVGLNSANHRILGWFGLGGNSKLIPWAGTPPVSQHAHPAYPWTIPWGAHTTGIPWQQEPGLRGRLRKKHQGSVGWKSLLRGCFVGFVSIVGNSLFPTNSLWQGALGVASSWAWGGLRSAKIH